MQTCHGSSQVVKEKQRLGAAGFEGGSQMEGITKTLSTPNHPQFSGDWCGLKNIDVLEVLYF